MQVSPLAPSPRRRRPACIGSPGSGSRTGSSGRRRQRSQERRQSAGPERPPTPGRPSNAPIHPHQRRSDVWCHPCSETGTSFHDHPFRSWLVRSQCLRLGFAATPDACDGHDLLTFTVTPLVWDGQGQTSSSGAPKRSRQLLITVAGAVKEMTRVPPAPIFIGSLCQETATPDSPRRATQDRYRSTSGEGQRSEPRLERQQPGSLPSRMPTMSSRQANVESSAILAHVLTRPRTGCTPSRRSWLPRWATMRWDVDKMNQESTR